MDERTCPICERPVPPSLSTNGQERVYCSKRCKHVAVMRRSYAAKRYMYVGRASPWPRSSIVSPLDIRRCPWCEVAFVFKSGHRDGDYCCISHRVARDGAHSPVEYGTCVRCGDPFVRRAGWVGQCCSHRCRSALDKRHRENLKRAGGQGERINLRDVGERDGWRCGICSKKIDPALVVPDWAAATIDHVLPLSLDGTHTLANVQVAHFRCNTMKGNRVVGDGEQLRLVG